MAAGTVIVQKEQNEELGLALTESGRVKRVKPESAADRHGIGDMAGRKVLSVNGRPPKAALQDGDLRASRRVELQLEPLPGVYTIRSPQRMMTSDGADAGTAQMNEMVAITEVDGMRGKTHRGGWVSLSPDYITPTEAPMMDPEKFRLV